MSVDLVASQARQASLLPGLQDPQMEWSQAMKFHKFADLFPLMPENELAGLASDIKQHGLREPIVLYEDKILDGRNRWRACKSVGVEPKTKEFSGQHPISFVISLNLKRRHLNDSQKAAIAVELLPMLETEAEKRVGGRPKKDRKPGTQIDLVFGRSREHAGRIMGVSHSYVAQAKAIQEAAPAAFQEIKAGQKTISEVARTLKKTRLLKSIPSLPKGKFRVFYADPPWKYGDTRNVNGWESTAAEDHYPTMSIAELCALPIETITATDAVLFLWVTSPLLFECQPVIRAWGFEYRSSFVWDKVKHNMGHYNSVRHEFLLVCARGSCTPDVPKLFDSVQSIERSGRHSEKPEAFRTIIDTLYPSGPRIELFARSKRKGWNAYGNEC